MAGDPLWPRTAIVSHWGFIRALTGLRVPNGHLLRFDPHSGEADGSDGKRSGGAPANVIARGPIFTACFP